MSDKPAKWTQQQAVDLCRKIETIAPKYGCHIALTGGTLYHFGERKDADILFYRIRQVEYIDVDGLMVGLSEIGVMPGKDYGWCYKATYEGRNIDCFFPEREGVGDEYPPDECAPSLRPVTIGDEVKFWTNPITAAEQRGKIAGLEEAVKEVGSLLKERNEHNNPVTDWYRAQVRAYEKAIAAIRALAEKERGS